MTIMLSIFLVKDSYRPKDVATAEKGNIGPNVVLHYSGMRMHESLDLNTQDKRPAVSSMYFMCI